MFGYEVVIYDNLIDEQHSKDEYGAWSETYSNEFESISKTKAHPDVVSTLDIKKGDICYVVWVEWSDGNSFGEAYCRCFETIGVFYDEQSAKELQTALENGVSDDQRDWDYSYSFYCKTSDGQEFKYKKVPWAGIFEHLEYVHLEMTTMG